MGMVDGGFDRVEALCWVLGSSPRMTVEGGEARRLGFEAEEVPGAIERLVDAYIARRSAEDETFIAAYRRLGDAPFKEAFYGNG